MYSCDISVYTFSPCSMNIRLVRLSLYYCMRCMHIAYTNNMQVTHALCYWYIWYAKLWYCQAYNCKWEKIRSKIWAGAIFHGSYH
jgi:hypothetical protein